MGRQALRHGRRFPEVAKKSKGETDDDASESGAGGADGGKKKGKSKKGPRVLGPKTVAKPCLVGAGLLTLLGAALPK